MKNKNILCIIPIVLSILSVSCGTTAAPVATTALTGTWKLGCTNNGGSAAPNYQTDTYVFTGLGVVETQQNFGTDTTCAAANLSYSMTTTSSFVLGAANAAATPATALFLNMTLSAQTVTPNTATAATYLNSIGCTPAITFTSGTTTSIIGETCGAGSTATVVGTVTYTIVSIVSTTTPNTIAFGIKGGTATATDGTTLAKTPTTVSTTTYAKQ